MKRIENYKNKNIKLIIGQVLSMLIVLICFQNLFLFAEGLTNNIKKDGIIIYVDGKKIETKSEKAFINNNMTMIPLRLISKNLGANVKWIDEERLILISKNDKFMYISIDKNKYIDNQSNEMDIKTIIKNSKTYVPIKTISEVLNFDLEWIGNNNGMVFLFSKNQSEQEKKVIIKRRIKEYNLSQRSYKIREIDAINLLNSLNIENENIKSIYTPLTNSYGVKYDIDELIDNSINFFYQCSNKNDYELNELIREYTDNENKEGLFTSDYLYPEEFIKHEKLLFKNHKTILSDEKYFKIYISAIDLSNSEVYLICFNYGQSSKDHNKINIKSIEISPKNSEKAFIKISDYKIKKRSQKSTKQGKNYGIIKNNSKIWTVPNRDNLTRTSFYIQKLVKGKYQDEFVSSYRVNDNWLNKKTRKKYQKMMIADARNILERSRLNDEEVEDYINSGFRINVYAEIKAIDPNDNTEKWYRFMKNGKDFTPYKKIFANNDISTLKNFCKTIVSNFPSNNIGCCKSFEFKGNKSQKKTIIIKFLDLDTNTEIKKSEKIVEYSNHKNYLYIAPKKIVNYYQLASDEKYNLEFDLKNHEETKEIEVFYKPLKFNSETADIVVDEWRLSKKYDSLLSDDSYKYAKFKFIPPTKKDDENINFFGIISPLDKGKFSLKSNSETNFMKVEFKKELDYDFSLKNKTIEKKCDAPIMLKRPMMNLGKINPSFETVANVRFTLSPEVDYHYKPIIKKIIQNVNNNSEEELVLGDKVSLDYQKSDAIYNISLMFPSYQSSHRISPKFDNYKFYDNNTNEFGLNISASETIKILPKVMMIYDREDGKTDVNFVRGKYFRQINPLSNHRGVLNLSSNLKVQTNVSDKRGATSLARAMGNQNMSVVDKGANIKMNYSSKDALNVISYSLELLNSDYGQSSYNSETYHKIYLNELGFKNNSIKAKIKTYLNSPNESEYKSANLVKNVEDKIIKHKLEIRSGRVISLDGIGYSRLSPRLKNVLDNMKLISLNPNNNVLGAFARNEGQIVTEEVFCKLSSAYRHIPHSLRMGWYNEDSLDLVLVERRSSFNLEPIDLNLKAPLNIKGLETPINDRMKYSRGRKIDVNLEIILANEQNAKFKKTIKSLFIIPNSEQ